MKQAGRKVQCPARRAGGRLLTGIVAGIMVVSLAACSDQQLLPEDTRSPGTSGGADAGTARPLDSQPGATEAPTGFVIGPGTDPTDFMKHAPHKLYAEFLNTGKSDSMLLRLDETVIMVDTGETDDYPAIQAALQKAGIGAIDYLIITHFDNDHIGCVAQLIADYPVKTVYMPDYVRKSSLYKRMMNALASAADDTAVHRLTEDVRLSFDWGSMWINPTSLYSPGLVLGADEDNQEVEENNYSLITSIYFGQVSLLLTGDAERARMEEFMALNPGRYTLVKTPHHGQSDKALLSALSDMSPRYCVICTDRADSVKSALVTKMRAIGAGAYYTYQGNILFATDGSGTVVVQ